MVRTYYDVPAIRRLVAALLLAACHEGAKPQPDGPAPGSIYSLDPSFGIGGTLTVTIPNYDYFGAPSLVTTGEGTVLMVRVSTVNKTDLQFCRFTSAGVLDPSFGSAGCVMQPWGAGRAIADGADLIIPGSSRFNDPVAGSALFRMRADGTLDDSYGIHGALPLDPPQSASTGRAMVGSVDAFPDGSFVAAGQYTSGNELWLQRVSGAAIEPGMTFERQTMIATGDGITLLRKYLAAPMECPPDPCSAGEACRYATCTPTPVACQGACPQAHRCDEALHECIPSHIAPEGTRVTRLSSTLATVGSAHVSGVEVDGAFPLPDGRIFVVDSFRGPWLLTRQNTQDRSFARTVSDVADLALRSDGGFVVVVEFSPQVSTLFELTASGTILTRQDNPIPEVTISDVQLIDDSLLLAVGRRGIDIVVMRLIRTVP